MSKCFGNVVNAAATGTFCRTHHTHFSDVNPFKRQHITKEEQKAELFNFLSDQRERRKRIEQRLANGARILAQAA